MGELFLSFCFLAAISFIAFAAGCGLQEGINFANLNEREPCAVSVGPPSSPP